MHAGRVFETGACSVIQRRVQVLIITRQVILLINLRAHNVPSRTCHLSPLLCCLTCWWLRRLTCVCLASKCAGAGSSEMRPMRQPPPRSRPMAAKNSSALRTEQGEKRCSSDDALSVWSGLLPCRLLVSLGISGANQEEHILCWPPSRARHAKQFWLPRYRTLILNLN